MADFPLKHSGVTARFITSSVDESAPAPISTVPYCVIGTADMGPAFVPFSFSDISSFRKFYGSSNGEHEAKILVRELIESGQAVTFVRVLGIGKGEPTLGSGRVSGAGFTVGENQIQTTVTNNTVVNRSLGPNPFAHDPADTSEASNSHGRTYFLGCFMKNVGDANRETKNDTIVRSGLDTSDGSVPILRAVLMAASGVSLSLSSSLTTNNSPLDAGVKGKFGDGLDAGREIGDIDMSDASQQFTLFQNGHKDASKRVVELSFNPSDDDIYFKDVLNKDPEKLEEEGHYLYTFYENIHAIEREDPLLKELPVPCKIDSVLDNDQHFGDNDLSGKQAAFCLRADSGIGKPSEAELSVESVNFTPAQFVITIPTAKYSSGQQQVPNIDKQITVLIKSEAPQDPPAQNTVEISTNGLVLNNNSDAHRIAERIVGVLNGNFDAGDDYVKFDIEATLTDKVNGQLIKGLTATQLINKVVIKSIRNGSVDDDFTISSNSNDLPTVDFSGGVNNLPGSSGTQSEYGLTLPNNSVSNRLGIPNFESFETRYSNARTPYFKSQEVFGRVYDLFKIHSVSDGEQDFSSIPVVTIKNIRPASSIYEVDGIIRRDLDLDSYGIFDIEITGQNNESPLLFQSASLDPSSDNFISKVVGDSHAFHNLESSERTVVSGKYASVSAASFGKFRVEVHPSVEMGEVPPSCLPFGFRGMPHLMLAGDSGQENEGKSIFSINDSGINSQMKNALKRIKEPPFPLRINQIGRQTDDYFSWGAMPELHNSGSFCKFFPTFNKLVQNPWVVDNVDRDTLGGEQVNCDKFNNNEFSLEKIALPAKLDGNNKTIVSLQGNEEDLFMTEQDFWDSAVYIRDGDITDFPSLFDDNEVSDTTRFLEPKDLLLEKVYKGAKFSCVMFGGFNGLNIFDKQKYRQTNRSIDDEQNEPSYSSIDDGPTFSAYKEALNVVKDRSNSDFDTIILPGISNSVLSLEALKTAEERFDTVYISNMEKYDSSGNLHDDVTSGSISGLGKQVPAFSGSLSITNFKGNFIDSSFSSTFFPGLKIRDRDLGEDSEKISISASSAASIIMARSQDTVGMGTSPTGVSNGLFPLGNAEKNFIVNTDKQKKLFSDAGINTICSGDSTGIYLTEAKTQVGNLFNSFVLEKTERKTRAAIKASSYYFLAHRRAMIQVRRTIRNISLRALFEENDRSKMEDLLSQRIESSLESLVDDRTIESFSVQIPHPDDIIETDIMSLAKGPVSFLARNKKILRGLITVRLMMSDIDEEIQIEVDEENQ